jgi:hypothetical protein
MRTTKTGARSEKVCTLGWKDKDWVDQELVGAYFQDVRLGQRLRTLLGLMSNGIGETIPFVCQDWANTKAAYRFFSNPRITEEEILSGHFASTQSRAAGLDEPILILHDTTEFSYQAAGAAMGLISTLPFPSKRKQTFRGVLMHSSLAVTTDGLPLGLAAVKFWTRKQFKGTNALKRKINPTRIPIEEKESMRWLENMRQSTELINQASRCVHVGDRESDIYELFCLAEELGTGFVIRTCVDRLAQDGQITMETLLKKSPVKGIHRIEVRNSAGEARQARLEIRFEKIQVRPPLGKQKDYPPLQLTFIHAKEISPPRGCAPIEWKLLTNLPVDSLESAMEKIGWYALRWKIETFHKILKSGCRAESSKLRTAERVTRLIAVFCILSWRIFWTTMVQRTDPSLPAKAGITSEEQVILNKLFGNPTAAGNLGDYLVRIARLGGYLARKNDGPPGNTVMWRGLSRLTDIQLGFLLARGDVGN